MSDPTYTPPDVWTWDQESGGRFASINRPIAGPTHDKVLPVGEHPLQLYSLGTPNGVKVTVMLEELLALGLVLVTLVGPRQGHVAVGEEELGQVTLVLRAEPLVLLLLGGLAPSVARMLQVSALGGRRRRGGGGGGGKLWADMWSVEQEPHEYVYTYYY